MLRPTGSTSSWINLGAGNASLNVQAGGAKFDTRGFDVGIDVAPVFVRIDAGIELRGVEPKLGRVAFQVRVRELRRVGEQLVVVRPEPALLAGARGRFSGGAGVRMVG